MQKNCLLKQFSTNFLIWIKLYLVLDNFRCLYTEADDIILNKKFYYGDKVLVL